MSLKVLSIIFNERNFFHFLISLSRGLFDKFSLEKKTLTKILLKTFKLLVFSKKNPSMRD